MRSVKSFHVAELSSKRREKTDSCTIHIEFDLAKTDSYTIHIEVDLAGWAQGGWTASGRESQIPIENYFSI